MDINSIIISLTGAFVSFPEFYTLGLCLTVLYDAELMTKQGAHSLPPIEYLREF